jgi:hypothetical protein
VKIGPWFVFLVFYFVAVMVTVVFLRDTNNHLFYTLQACRTDQARLKQELWQKQLQLESLTRPDAVMRLVTAPKADHARRP